MNRLPHEWDDDAICIHCGFDGAEDFHINNNLRLEIGEDEYKYRRDHGEFDVGRYCPKRYAEAMLKERDHGLPSNEK